MLEGQHAPDANAVGRNPRAWPNHLGIDHAAIATLEVIDNLTKVSSSGPATCEYSCRSVVNKTDC